ncbi:hypothetical protein D3C73_964540 [compost metagenome]
MEDLATEMGTSLAGFFISPAALFPDSKPRNENSRSGVTPRKPASVGEKKPRSSPLKPCCSP